MTNPTPPPLDAGALIGLLDPLPLGLALTDGDGAIAWTNQTLCAQLGLAAEELRGRSLDQLPMEGARRETAEGQLYHLPDSVGGAEWLARVDLIWKTGPPGWGAACYVDVSDAERARIQVDRLRQALTGQVATDQATGLLNRRGVLSQLEAQVSRSRRYQNPLSVLIARLVAHTGTTESPGQPLLVAAAQLLRDQTRWPDIIGRWSEREFLLVLPETSMGAARTLVDKVRTGLERDSARRARMAFGLAEWRPGDDALGLVQRTLSSVDEE